MGLRTIAGIVALIASGLVPVSLAPGIAPATAATIAVSRTDDPPPNGCPPSDCSLREAITAANLSPGLDTISLPAGAYTLSIAGQGEDAGGSGDLDILEPVNITGAGTASTTIDANQLDRVLDILTTDNEPFEITALTIRGGQAGVEFGGGVRIHDGQLTLTDVVIESNSARWGGGIYTTAEAAATGHLRVVNSRIEMNSATERGGGMLNRGNTEVTSVVFRSNLAESGGALAQFDEYIDVLTSTFENNSARLGGAIHNETGETVEGMLTLSRTTLSGNAAVDRGGAIFNKGALAVDSSTLNGNSAQDGGALSQGLYWISNSTISGNIATGVGGAAYLCYCLLSGTTVTNNAAGSSADGFYLNETVQNGGGIEASHSIIGGNGPGGTDCEGDGGFILPHGHNIIENNVDCFIWMEGPGNIYGVDPLLGALADNGGATQTHAPLPGSPAVDAGEAASATDFFRCQPTDQRGTARPQGPACDAGAVEVLGEPYDGDGDSVPNVSDNCPDVVNADQTDTDADGHGDACDTDDDDDEVPDEYELAHACLNSLVVDAGDDPDTDGLASREEFTRSTDACQEDTDDDGLNDGFEVNIVGTNPLAPDSEWDGMPDGYEVSNVCLRPVLYDSLADPDADGVASFNEMVIGTDPCDADTDNDHCRDGAELATNPMVGGGRNPNDAWDFFDVTGDARIDISDTLEVLAIFGTGPGDSAYDPLYDRYIPDSNRPWRTAAAAGMSTGITLQDALVSLQSFGHDCTAVS